MLIFIVLASGLFIKCAGIPTTCESISPLVFSGLAASGVLELIYEVKGFISIFGRRDNDDIDKDK